MNRLHQLKQTLPQNILDNEDYEQLEYILLDYNSTDGMSEWVKSNFSKEIENGKVTYYKTEEPESWSPSHSKNVAFKLAKGDIICNIWADYFTGKSFAHYVNDSFIKNENIVLTPIDFPKTDDKHYAPKDVLGKVCVKKTDFLKVRGFDELMNKHGFEDYDFIMRLIKNGVERELIKDFSFLKYIAHEDSERFELPSDHVFGVFVNHISPSKSDVIILFNSKTYKKGILIDCSIISSDQLIHAYTKRDYLFEYTLEQDWEIGEWENPTDILDATYSEITEQSIKNDLLVFDHFYYTRSIFEKNMLNKDLIINQQHFGKCKVMKNFTNNYIQIS